MNWKFRKLMLCMALITLTLSTGSCTPPNPDENPNSGDNNGGEGNKPINPDEVIAFPGAVGFGRFAKGGRYGEVYHVTTLADSGAGSFRDAVSQPNRIVVFDVAGVIRISSIIKCSRNLTIAGQTAPGDGVIIYGDGVSFSDASNTIVRYLRVYEGVGDNKNDACGQASGKDCIYDHLSVLWGRDENFSVNWYKPNPDEPGRITIQNSILGQGLQTHSCGGLLFSSVGITLYRNLYIDNKTRNPKTGGVMQYINNVVYNWSSGGAYICGASESEYDSWGHLVGNYFIKGPVGATVPVTRGTGFYQLCHEGNYYDANTNGILDGRAMINGDYANVTLVDSLQVWYNAPDDKKKLKQTFPDIANVMSAKQAVGWVQDSVGACLPMRTLSDQYLIDELKSYGTKGALITSEMEVGIDVTGSIRRAPSRPDRDNDGIPDSWENAHGLNPDDPTDAMKITASGYANIELYINSITAPEPFIMYPTDLNTISFDSSSAQIGWSIAALDPQTESIVIEQKSGYLPYAEIATVQSNTISYKVTALSANTTYKFRLKCKKGSMISAYSDELVVKTPAQ